MFKTPQQGLTLLGNLIVVFIAGFIIYLLFRLVPLYIQDYIVANMLNGYAKESYTIKRNDPAAVTSIADIDNKLNKLLAVNNIRNLTIADNFTIAPTDDGYQITARYEDRAPLFGNIAIVIRFNHSVMVPR